MNEAREMKHLVTALSFFVLSVIALPAQAELTTKLGNLEFSAGIGTWISTGSTRWSHNASTVSPLLGNPTSELHYKDLLSNVVELRGQVTLAKSWFFRANYGFGDIRGGRLIDDDYVSPAVAEASFGGNTRFSRTFSDVEGNNLWYVNADLGYKFSFFKEQAQLRLFLGYQYWKERVEATGVTQVECTAPSVLCDPVGAVSFRGRKVITNTVQWHSLRLGLEGGYQITPRISLDGSAVFIPYTAMKNEDIHHLRADLRQDPSFSMEGTGHGVNLEGTASYLLIKDLVFSVGYRYWLLNVTDGTWQNHPVVGAADTVNLNLLKTFRQGWTLGLTYRF